MSIPCLLMPWRPKEPGHQHAWYWPNKTEYSVSSIIRVIINSYRPKQIVFISKSAYLSVFFTKIICIFFWFLGIPFVNLGLNYPMLALVYGFVLTRPQVIYWSSNDCSPWHQVFSSLIKWCLTGYRNPHLKSKMAWRLSCFMMEIPIPIRQCLLSE